MTIEINYSDHPCDNCIHECDSYILYAKDCHWYRVSMIDKTLTTNNKE